MIQAGVLFLYSSWVTTLVTQLNYDFLWSLFLPLSSIQVVSRSLCACVHTNDQRKGLVNKKVNPLKDHSLNYYVNNKKREMMYSSPSFFLFLSLS